jgi:hypothetical protein
MRQDAERPTQDEITQAERLRGSAQRLDERLDFAMARRVLAHRSDEHVAIEEHHVNDPSSGHRVHSSR